MELQAQRDLRLLDEVARDASVSQRSLAKSLGVALGLTNLYVKRLVRKGYIKITTIPRHRLKYLAEAEFSVMGLGGVPPQTVAAMRKLAPDIVAFEQLTDILRHRSFRQTLLVHDDAPIDRRLGSHSILPFMIASPVSVMPRDASKPANAPPVVAPRPPLPAVPIAAVPLSRVEIHRF